MLDNTAQVADPQNTRERIIVAAEELLRRYGPAKTKVVDVARHLGMSHASVYRHFESKAEMQDVVAARWLERISQPLAGIVKGRGSPSRRLRRWVDALIDIRMEKFRDDPELFATYNALSEISRDVIAEHVETLREQLVLIIAEGVAEEEFKVKDIAAAARAVHEATARFQHPFFITRTAKHSDTVKPVMDLIIAGLKADVI